MTLQFPVGGRAHTSLLALFILAAPPLSGLAQLSGTAVPNPLYVQVSPQILIPGEASSAPSGCLSIAQIAEQRESGQLAAGAQTNLCELQNSQPQMNVPVRPQASPEQTVEALAESRANATTGSGGFAGFLDSVSFPTMNTVASGITTVVTLSADFMKHGSKDLLTIDSKAQLHLLANNGNGTFAAPITSSGSVAGLSFTGYLDALVQDYDNDGYPDVIARDATSYRLTFFHNNHDGTFTLAKYLPLPVDYGAAAFIKGDVNGDGVDDLTVFVTKYTSSTGNTELRILTFQGTGRGDFSGNPIETDYSVIGANIIVPNRGAILGLNANRKTLYFEALSLNSYGVNGATVFAVGLYGDGSFMANPYAQKDFPSVNPYVNTYSAGFTVSDLNGDGIPDLTMSFSDGNIYSALGAADGSFMAAVVANPSFTVTAQSSVLADINGDGYPDLLVKDVNTLYVLPGQGTGLFGYPSNYYTVSTSSSAGYYNSPGFNLVYDDFTGDGTPDVVYLDTGYNGTNRAVLMTGQGSGNFIAPVALPADTQLGYDIGHLYGEAMFDTNGDGLADVLVLDTNGVGPYYVRTALSDGKGGYTFVKALAATQGVNTLATILTNYDFNGDGLQDLVLDAYYSPKAGTYYHTLAVSLSNGDGTFATPTILNTNNLPLNYALSSVAVGDINGDGIPDIVAVTVGGTSDAAAILTFFGKSDGTFQPAVAKSYGHTFTYAGIALADFSGDGKLDLLISDDGTSGSVLPTVSLVPGDNSGVFDTTKAVTITSGLSIRKALIGDLNGDKSPDLVLLSAGQVSGSTTTTTDRAAIIYLNNGKGSLTRGTSIESGSLGGTGLLADFNGDGNLDLVFATDLAADRASATTSGTQLLLGKGNGTFGAPADLTLPPSVSFLASGDVDGDGTRDLMSFSYYVGSIAILRNISGVTLGVTADKSTISAAQGVNLTATVAATVDHRPTPVGTVTFLLGGATLGTGSLQGGTASLYASALPVGADKITVVYSGDSNFSANRNGASTVVTVTSAPVVTPDFSIAVPSGGLSLASGQQGSASFTLTANSAYSGSVALTAEDLPKNMTVTFSSPSVTLAPSGTTSVTINVSTNSSASAALTVGRSYVFAGSLFCLMLGFRHRLQSVQLFRGVLLVATLFGAFTLSGCAGNSTSTSSGDYTIVVRATPAIAGATPKAFNLTIHVN